MARYENEERPLLNRCGRSGASRVGARWAGLAVGAGVCLSALALAPSEAQAALPDDRVEFSMYGRMGVAWALNGQNIQGQSMNLTDRSIGGRFEEGDYLEPTIRAHILQPDKENKDATYVDLVFTPAMFARNGSLLGLFSNNANNTLGIEIFQTYIEAGNVFIPGLSFWGGARFYRGADVHIADYFYFNDLSGQGGGVKYKNLDLALLVHTANDATYPGYNFDSEDADDTPDMQRLRTVFVAQYKHEFGGEGKHAVFGLAELHLLPEAQKGLGGAELAPGDHGFVVGAKLHLDLNNGSFNDVSVRYGNRIANGAAGGRKTWQTFGPPEPNGHYDGAYGLEVVDHFLFNIHPMFTLNGYGVLNLSTAAFDARTEADQGFIQDPKTGQRLADRSLNFAAGIRTFLYPHKQFHLINEVTFQGRQDGDLDMGTALKLSVVPTIVPTGDTTAWGRPHLRAIYTAAFYNKASEDQLLSPYLRAVGGTRVGHYLGARAEWWF